jgi:hypothetical protein
MADYNSDEDCKKRCFEDDGYAQCKKRRVGGDSESSEGDADREEGELNVTFRRRKNVDDPDAGCAPMSQMQFGGHLLHHDYRMSLPPFYTSDMVISTYLGHNEDHPGESEWLEMQCEMSASEGSGSDTDWKEDEGGTSTDNSEEDISNDSDDSDDVESDDSGIE